MLVQVSSMLVMLVRVSIPTGSALTAAVRRAKAMIVSIGFVPDAVGKALASPIQTPGASWSSPHGSATELDGSRPMRQVPIWWAEKSRNSRGAIGAPHRLDLIAFEKLRQLVLILSYDACKWDR